MRKPGGYVTITDASGGVEEYDSFTCGHCQHIVHVPPMTDPANIGGLCKACMKMICPNCLGKDCIPWEKQMEIMEAQHRRDELYDAIRE